MLEIIVKIYFYDLDGYFAHFKAKFVFKCTIPLLVMKCSNVCVYMHICIYVYMQQQQLLVHTQQWLIHIFKPFKGGQTTVNENFELR